jgi:hypothetical protein
LLRVEFCAISPSTDIWFTGSSPWYGRQVPRAGGGYTIESISLPTGSVKKCASGGFFGFSELASPAAGSTYTIKIDLVNNGVQFSKSFNVSTTADSSGPVITNLAVTPTSISSGQAISVTMKATDAAGVIGCGATVYNVNGIDVVTNSVSTLNSSTGFYTVDIVMNSGNNPGSYTVRGFCNDNNLNKTTTGEIVSFTIAGASVSAISSMPTPITIGINYLDQIVLNGFNFGTISAAPSNYTWTVRTQTASGAVVSNIPTGSNQTYITGLSGSTTYYVYLVATDSAGQTRVSSALVVTTLVPAVTPTMYQFIDPGSVIIPVRSGQTWEIGFKNAISVTLVAKSYGKADITASYAQSCNISTSCVTAVADGDALGKKLYRAMIYPPVDAPRGVLYSLTWIAVSSTGVSTEINSGSFITGS